MTETQALFLLLAAIYAADCVLIVQREEILFRAGPRRTCRWTGGESLVGGGRIAFAFLYPLPMLGRAFACRMPSLSISAGGLSTWTAQAPNPGPRPTRAAKYVPFEGLGGAAPRGKEILIGGRPFGTAGTEAEARRMARLVEALRGAGRGERERMLRDDLDRSLDAGAARARVREFESRSEPLRWACNFLFIFLFVVAPVWVAQRNLAAAWIPLAAVLAATLAIVGIAFASAHKALYPGEKGARWSSLAALVLAPPGAVRACDALSRDLLSSFHPAAAAAALCAPEEARRFARLALRDALHPIPPACPEGEAGLRETEEAHRRRLVAALEAFVEREHGSVAHLLAPPNPGPGPAGGWCPRCEEIYAPGAGACSDCGGLPLAPVDPGRHGA